MTGSQSLSTAAIAAYSIGICFEPRLPRMKRRAACGSSMGANALRPITFIHTGKDTTCLFQNSRAAALLRQLPPDSPPSDSRHLGAISRRLPGQHGTRAHLAPAGARVVAGIHRKQGWSPRESDGPCQASHRGNPVGRRVRRRAWRRRPLVGPAAGARLRGSACRPRGGCE